MLLKNLFIFAGEKRRKMEYDSQEERKTTMASEAALAYEVSTRTTTLAELEEECMPLEESKRLLLERVHQHYHPQA